MRLRTFKQGEPFFSGGTKKGVDILTLVLLLLCCCYGYYYFFVLFFVFCL